MAQLQNAVPHLFPTVDHPDHIHLANSTALDDPVAPLDNAFLNNFLSDTNRLLLSSDNIAAATDESPQVLSDNNVVLSALNFYTGRKREQMCSYNGYCYALNKSRPMDTATGTARTADNTIPLAKDVSSLSAPIQ